jgi:hypothetical protein
MRFAFQMPGPDSLLLDPFFETWQRQGGTKQIPALCDAKNCLAAALATVDPIVNFVSQSTFK